MLFIYNISNCGRIWKPYLGICEILLCLTEKDLFSFGSSSKFWHTKVELVWKVKLDILLGGHLDQHLDRKGMDWFFDMVQFGKGTKHGKNWVYCSDKSWFRLYYMQKGHFVRFDLKNLIYQLELTDFKRDKFNSIFAIYDYVKKNKDMFFSNGYRPTNKVLRKKLVQFIEEDIKFMKKGIVYLEELYPKTYEKLYAYDLSTLFGAL